MKAGNDLHIIHLFIGATSSKQCGINCNKCISGAAILRKKTKYKVNSSSLAAILEKDYLINVTLHHKTSPFADCVITHYL